MLLNRYRLRPLLALFAVTIALFSLTDSASAEEIYHGDTIPAGTTVENDVILNGDNVTVAGNVDGDLLAVGNNITIDGNVSGSAIIIGQNVVVNGQVGGSLYALALSLSLGEKSRIENNLYFAGVQFTSGKGSQIGRDMNGVMLSARLEGSVGRDIKAMIGLLELIRFALEMQSGFPDASSAIPALSDAIAQQTGEPARFRYAKTAPLAPPAQDSDGQTAVPDNPLAGMGIELLRRLVMFLIVGGLLAWLWPDLLGEWADQVRQRPFSALGNGFVFYFTGFIALLFALFLALAVGLVLFRIQFGELAWIFWGISFSGIGLAFWLFLALLVFVSKVIVAYLGGLFLFEKIYAPAASHKVWPLLAGLFIYLILAAVPYLGWFVGLLVTWLGMGAALIVYRRRASQIEDALLAGPAATAASAK